MQMHEDVNGDDNYDDDDNNYDDNDDGNHYDEKVIFHLLEGISFPKVICFIPLVVDLLLLSPSCTLLPVLFSFLTLFTLGADIADYPNVPVFTLNWCESDGSLFSLSDTQ